MRWAAFRPARGQEGSRWTSGYTGVEMTVRDMARIGYLYLRQGRWGGEQVIPADWVVK